MIGDKTKIGTRVWHGRRKAVTSSRLLGPEGAGDYMFGSFAFEITYEDGTKAQVEPKDLRKRPCDKSFDDRIAEVVSKMTEEQKRRFLEYVRDNPNG